MLVNSVVIWVSYVMVVIIVRFGYVVCFCIKITFGSLFMWLCGFVDDLLCGLIFDVVRGVLIVSLMYCVLCCVVWRGCFDCG